MDTFRTDIILLLKQLPAVYYEYGSAQGEPIRALLSVMQFYINSVEEAIDELPVYFNPDSAPLPVSSQDSNFLSWLAQWVAFVVEEDWIKPSTTHEVDEQVEKRLRYLVKNAAALYQMRGTPEGLCIMLSAFYDMNVKLIEWAWPQGMEIGTHSSIGLDSCILDKPDRLQTFVMLWQPSEEERKYVEPLANWLELTYQEDQGGGDYLLTGVYNSALPPTDPVKRKLMKILQFIRKERPIHTYCYVAMEKPPQELVAKSSLALVVGVESTIGISVIDEGY